VRYLLALVVFALIAAPAAADVSGPDIVSFLNAQREANGIPAGITEDPALTDGCVKHNAYDARNNTLTHQEDPGAPGYTAEGAQAGQTSVLYQGPPTWTATSNPFETAPIHLHQLLNPRLDRMGASENGGYGCATTLASQNRPAPPADVTYTYPGDGRTGWPPAQIASEGPYTPGEEVGIPAGTQTGPYLYVMFDGPDLIPSGEDVASVSGTLTGPAGPVDVAVANSNTPGLEGYLPTGMEVIPRAPLTAFTTYTASVSATIEGRQFIHQWSFTTGGAIQGRGYTVGKVQVNGRHATVLITPQVPLKIKLRVTGKHKHADLPAQTLAEPGSIGLHIPKRFGNKPRLRLTITAGDKTTTVVRRVHL
jgi:hypothetical protein